jgi:hypothetical protein
MASPSKLAEELRGIRGSSKRALPNQGLSPHSLCLVSGWGWQRIAVGWLTALKQESREPLKEAFKWSVDTRVAAAVGGFYCSGHPITGPVCLFDCSDRELRGSIHVLSLSLIPLSGHLKRWVVVCGKVEVSCWRIGPALGASMHLQSFTPTDCSLSVFGVDKAGRPFPPVGSRHIAPYSLSSHSSAWKADNLPLIYIRSRLCRSQTARLRTNLGVLGRPPR